MSQKQTEAEASPTFLDQMKDVEFSTWLIGVNIFVIVILLCANGLDWRKIRKMVNEREKLRVDAAARSAANTVNTTALLTTNTMMMNRQSEEEAFPPEARMPQRQFMDDLRGIRNQLKHRFDQLTYENELLSGQNRISEYREEENDDQVLQETTLGGEVTAPSVRRSCLQPGIMK